MQHEAPQLIPENHEFYQILTPCLQETKSVFSITQKDHPSKLQSKFPLKMYCRQNTQEKYHCFIYFFTFPISPQEYLKAMKDYELQKKLDTNTDEYRIYREAKNPNTQILYYSTKQVLIVKPRYIVQIEGNLWVFTVSDPKAENIKNKTKAEIIKTVARLKPVQGGCQISIYSEIDFKMALKFEASMTRGFSEIKKYLQKLYDVFKGQ